MNCLCLKLFAQTFVWYFFLNLAQKGKYDIYKCLRIMFRKIKCAWMIKNKRENALMCHDKSQAQAQQRANYARDTIQAHICVGIGPRACNVRAQEYTCMWASQGTPMHRGSLQMTYVCMGEDCLDKFVVQGQSLSCTQCKRSLNRV